MQANNVPAGMEAAPATTLEALQRAATDGFVFFADGAYQLRTVAGEINGHAVACHAAGAYVSKQNGPGLRVTWTINGKRASRAAVLALEADTPEAAAVARAEAALAAGVEASEAQAAYYAWQHRAQEAQAASPAHRGAYLFDANVDRENTYGYFADGSAEYWRGMLRSAVDALAFRCEGAGLDLLEVPAVNAPAPVAGVPQRYTVKLGPAMLPADLRITLQRATGDGLTLSVADARRISLMLALAADAADNPPPEGQPHDLTFTAPAFVRGETVIDRSGFRHVVDEVIGNIIYTMAGDTVHATKCRRVEGAQQ